MSQQFRGLGVALITPFKKREVDYDALAKVISHTIDGGVDYVVSLGTTGEAITLTSKECRQILDFTIEQVNGRVPIVAGHFGGNDTQALIQRIQEFDFSNIDGILSSSPSYNKPSQEGIYQHYCAVAEVSPRPIIIYNVPGRTASNVEAETILRIAHQCTNVVAVKDASANMVQAMQTIQDKPKHFSVLSGDDPTSFPFISVGGEGVISVIANAYPKEFAGVVHNAMKGNTEKARQYNEMLIDIHQWLYKDGSPSGIKAAMNILGLCENELRLPLVPCSNATISGLKSEMAKLEKKLTVFS